MVPVKGQSRAVQEAPAGVRRRVAPDLAASGANGSQERRRAGSSTRASGRQVQDLQRVASHRRTAIEDGGTAGKREQAGKHEHFPAESRLIATTTVHWHQGQFRCRCGARGAGCGRGGNWVRSTQWGCSLGRGSAKGGDVGASKSTNNQGAQKVGPSVCWGPAGGKWTSLSSMVQLLAQGQCQGRRYGT